MRRGNRQILVTLAMSVLILCIRYPYPGFVLTGIESLLILVGFLFLILFVVKRASALYEFVLANSFFIAGFVFPVADDLLFVDDASADTFPISNPILPLRYQLPPPYLSV